MSEGAADFLSIGHFKMRVPRSEHTAITDLAAAFRVERSLVEDDLARLPLMQNGNALIILQQGDDHSFAMRMLIAGKCCFALDGGSAAQVHGEFARGTRSVALCLHGRIEPRLVDRQSALARNISREIDRKTVGIVKLEDRCSGNLLAR